jgi:hypothetical protein
MTTEFWWENGHMEEQGAEKILRWTINVVFR